jgi:hypothetical protein
MSAINLHVYVVHCKRLTQRREMCEALHKIIGSMEDVHVTFEYIEERDPDTLQVNAMNSLVNLEPLKDVSYADDFNGLLRPLTIPSLSNLLKHYEAYGKIKEHAKAERKEKSDEKHMYMVIEDDTCFDNKVARNLQRVLRHEQLPADYDLVFLGFPHTLPVPKDFLEIREIFKVIPGCDSYLVSPSCAEKLHSHMVPIKFIGNIQLSYLIAKLELRAYMSHPHVFIEGSKLGIYSSTINPNNSLIYNSQYAELAQILGKKEELTLQEKERFEKVWDECRFKENPDVMYLRCLYYIKDGKYSQAMSLCDETFDECKKRGVIMNRQSAFLNRYIDLCRMVQAV